MKRGKVQSHLPGSSGFSVVVVLWKFGDVVVLDMTLISLVTVKINKFSVFEIYETV